MQRYSSTKNFEGAIMYTKTRNKITVLEDSLDDLAATERTRPLNKQERGFRAEILTLLDDLKNQLPEPAVTRPVGRAASVPRGGFSTLGEQLQAVARAGTPGGQTDPRLWNAAGLGETVPSDGGFLVQQDFSERLLRGAFETGILAPRCNRISITSGANSIRLPAPDETSRVSGSRWGGVQTSWLAEGAEATASKPKFRQIELNLKKLVGVCYLTDEILQDSAVLETVVAQAFSDEIGFQLDDSIINGTGAGMPLGILNSGCLVEVEAEESQAAGTILFENIVKMYSRMPARNRKTACWLVNQQVETQLFTMSLMVGDGGAPVYLPAGGASQEPYSVLFGRPVIPIEQCSELGERGDIILADLSSYILAEKGGIQTDLSIHVRFLYDESVLRFVYRVDGQPSLAVPITPYKGADPVGPFVTLAKRK